MLDDLRFNVHARFRHAMHPVYGVTPRYYFILHRAVFRRNLAAVDFLIARGADVNARTSEGESVLYCAVQQIYHSCEMIMIVERLLECSTLQVSRRV